MLAGGAEAEIVESLGVMVARLRAARGRVGLTQEQLAAALCISVWTLRAWELRRQYPSMLGMIRWCGAVGFRLIVVGASGVERHPEREVVKVDGSEQSEMRRLAAVLREVREQCEITQAALAARLGVSRSSLKGWESGAGHPRPLGLLRWARSLGCQVILVAA